MSIGLVFLMFTVDVNWFLFPGIMFLCSGGFALLVSNHPLSQLFPKATAFIIVFGQCVFQAGSMFRLWSVMFDAGISFKSIIGINLVLTSIQWIRTIFLMPVYKINKDIPPFYQSPFNRKHLTGSGNQPKNIQKTGSDEQPEVTASSIIFSFEFTYTVPFYCN